MRLLSLEDPARMYWIDVRQVPLLTREQEVDLGKRIEEAEEQAKASLDSSGLTGKELMALAKKLISDAPKERFARVIVDKKVNNRDTHLKELRRLVKQVKAIDEDVDERYAAWRGASSNAEKTRRFNEFQKADQKLQRTF